MVADRFHKLGSIPPMCAAAKPTQRTMALRLVLGSEVQCQTSNLSRHTTFEHLAPRNTGLLDAARSLPPPRSPGLAALCRERPAG
jgi:hypothetical protein